MLQMSSFLLSSKIKATLREPARIVLRLFDRCWLFRVLTYIVGTALKSVTMRQKLPLSPGFIRIHSVLRAFDIVTALSHTLSCSDVLEPPGSHPNVQCSACLLRIHHTFNLQHCPVITCRVPHPLLDFFQILSCQFVSSAWRRCQSHV